MRRGAEALDSALALALALGLALALTPTPTPTLTLTLTLPLIRPTREQLLSALDRVEAEVRRLRAEVRYLVITPTGGGGAPPESGGALPSYRPYGRRRCTA